MALGVREDGQKVLLAVKNMGSESEAAEIGNALTAEEMEGQHAIDGAAHAPEKPKPESVTPPSAGGESKPLPPLVSQPQSSTASSSAELPGPFAARQEGDREIPHALAPPSE